MSACLVSAIALLIGYYNTKIKSQTSPKEVDRAKNAENTLSNEVFSASSSFPKNIPFRFIWPSHKSSAKVSNLFIIYANIFQLFFISPY